MIWDSRNRRANTRGRCRKTSSLYEERSKRTALDQAQRVICSEETNSGHSKSNLRESRLFGTPNMFECIERGFSQVGEILKLN